MAPCALWLPETACLATSSTAKKPWSELEPFPPFTPSSFIRLHPIQPLKLDDIEMSSSSPSYLPLSNPLNASRPTGRRGLLAFIGTAAFAGLAFHILFLGLGGQEAVRDIPVVKEWLPAGAAVTVTVTHTATAPGQCKTPAPAIQYDIPSSISKPSVAVGSGTEPWDHEPDLEALRRMVAKTKGYLTRDYSLGLGWNNVCTDIRYQEHPDQLFVTRCGIS